MVSLRDFIESRQRLQSYSLSRYSLFVVFFVFYKVAFKSFTERRKLILGNRLPHRVQQLYKGFRLFSIFFFVPFYVHCHKNQKRTTLRSEFLAL